MTEAHHCATKAAAFCYTGRIVAPVQNKNQHPLAGGPPMRRQFSVLLWLTLALVPQPVLASPIGLWRAHDDAIIRISRCGHDLCGFIVKTNPRVNSRTGAEDYSDRYNMDAAKRHRSRIGIEVLISMKPAAHSEWLGQMYSDRNGHTYEGKLVELSRTEIKIEGCWLVLCGGELLSRVK